MAHVFNRHDYLPANISPADTDFMSIVLNHAQGQGTRTIALLIGKYETDLEVAKIGSLPERFILEESIRKLKQIYDAKVGAEAKAWAEVLAYKRSRRRRTRIGGTPSSARKGMRYKRKGTEDNDEYLDQGSQVNAGNEDLDAEGETDLEFEGMEDTHGAKVSESKDSG
ncbi:MAG: hypothetical protein M1820_008324 [Bogoriella megaspora]|nr:MAG: hypothetical protein M1820_008324 [Bogoriella megaspora]